MLALVGLEASRHLRVKIRVWGSFLTPGRARKPAQGGLEEADMREPSESGGNTGRQHGETKL